jgi:hypothetical protein
VVLDGFFVLEVIGGTWCFGVGGDVLEEWIASAVGGGGWLDEDVDDPDAGM